MNWYKKATLELSREERDKINDDFIKELSEEYLKVWTPIDSSFIHEVSYNENTKILRVKIRSQGTIKTYKFINVPKNVYDNFMAAPSKGNFFNNIIKRRFDNTRVASQLHDEHIDLEKLSPDERYGDEFDNYVSIGHTWKKGKPVDIWAIDNNGEIFSKESFNPQGDTHPEILGFKSDVYNTYLAYGRVEHNENGIDICSLLIQKSNSDKLIWIKELLKERFGKNIIIKVFFDY